MSLEVAIQNLADAINNLANASGQTKLPLVDLSHITGPSRPDKIEQTPEEVITDLADPHPEPPAAEQLEKKKPGRPKTKVETKPAPAPTPDPAPTKVEQTTTAVTLDQARARFAAKAREPGIGLAKVQALIKAAGVDTIASLEPPALAALLAKVEALT